MTNDCAEISVEYFLYNILVKNKANNKLCQYLTTKIRKLGAVGNVPYSQRTAQELYSSKSEEQGEREIYF